MSFRFRTMVVVIRQVFLPYLLMGIPCILHPIEGMVLVVLIFIFLIKMLQEIGADDPGFFAKVTSRIKIGRLVRPEEIASMVAYLCSDDAAPITGQSLVVDGGVIQS